MITIPGTVQDMNLGPPEYETEVFFAATIVKENKKYIQNFDRKNLIATSDALI
jgi:hypothetical protein